MSTVACLHNFELDDPPVSIHHEESSGTCLSKDVPRPKTRGQTYVKIDKFPGRHEFCYPTDSSAEHPPIHPIGRMYYQMRYTFICLNLFFPNWPLIFFIQLLNHQVRGLEQARKDVSLGKCPGVS